jgi:(2Fe-2S) ferredoxin
MGAYCNQGHRAVPFYHYIEARLGKSDTPHSKLVWTTTSCLSMCGAGPNLLILPDDVAYHHLTQETLTKIITEFLDTSR